jgi:hypothetical protein
MLRLIIGANTGNRSLQGSRYLKLASTVGEATTIEVVHDFYLPDSNGPASYTSLGAISDSVQDLSRRAESVPGK